MTERHIQSYFSHDSNARNDVKILNLRSKLGAEGYGIYFMILERLREAPDYMSVKDYNALAFDLRVDSAKIKSVVENFGLFAFTEDGECFYSESFRRRMNLKDKKKEDISEARRQAAKARWEKEEKKEKSNPNANAMQMQCKCNASKMQNDAKEKKSKVKKSKVNIYTTTTNIDNDKDLDKAKNQDDLCVAVDKFTQNQEIKRLLKDFISMRSKIKRPFTLRTLEIFLEQLKSLSTGDDKMMAQILRASLINDWENIYPIKATTGGSVGNQSKLDEYYGSNKRQTDEFTDDELKDMFGIKGSL